MILPEVTLSQSFTLPTVIVDSLIFEVRKGRSCQVVREAQAKELEAQGAELLQTQKALSLSTSYSQLKDTETNNLRQALSAQEKITVETGKREHKKGLKQGFIGGAIAVTVVRVGIKLFVGK